jgi:alpha-beta hydrolase superfamily lysophospholipase
MVAIDKPKRFAAWELVKNSETSGSLVSVAVSMGGLVGDLEVTSLAHAGGDGAVFPEGHSMGMLLCVNVVFNSLKHQNHIYTTNQHYSGISCP